MAAISGFSAVFLPEGCDVAVRLLKVDFVEGERRFGCVQDRRTTIDLSELSSASDNVIRLWHNDTQKR